MFVSYASSDRKTALQLHQYLVEHGHSVFLDVDRHSGFRIGQDWEDRLYTEVRSADVMVCLVSAANLASTWCAIEVAAAKLLGAQLLPLSLQAEVRHPLLEGLQHADVSAGTEVTFATVEAALRDFEATGLAGWPDGENPYPGLHPFDSRWQRVFFGRDREVQRLAAELRSPPTGEVLIVIGPSGCGKSSMMRAGLIPLVAAETDWWVLPPVLPGSDPVEALAREVAGEGVRLGLPWTLADVRTVLSRTEGLVDLASQLMIAASGRHRRRRLLLVIDQFEEVLTQANEHQRHDLAGLLATASTGPVAVTATARPEFLTRLLADSQMAMMPVRAFPLRPVGPDTLKTIIVEPARVAGFVVPDSLVGRLLTDTGTGEALPLLAYTLQRLAEGVSRGGALSEERYEEIGGVAGTLTGQADAALVNARTRSGRSEREIIADLLRLVTVDDGGHPTRRRIALRDLPEHARTELDAFIDRRLVTIEDTDGSTTVEVAHEAFISSWPPLVEAVAVAASGLHTRRQLEIHASEWQANHRSRKRLWGGGQLAAARENLGVRLHRSGPRSRIGRRQRLLITSIAIDDTARQFMHASLRRDRWLHRRLVTVLTGLLVLALATAGLALNSRQHAQEQQRTATALQLVAQAQNIRERDPNTALRLAIAAYDLHPGPETQASLFETLDSTHLAASLASYAGSMSRMEFSPDGRTLVTGTSDGTIVLWSIREDTKPQQLSSWQTSPVSSMVLSPDGKILATSNDQMVILWSIADPTHPQRLGTPFTGNNGPVMRMAFSPDAHILAATALRGTVTLWDLAEPTDPRELARPPTQHEVLKGIVVFNPDGRTLATINGNGTVILWNLADRNRPRQLNQPPIEARNPTLWAAFSPDGRTLVTSGYTDTLTFWDVTIRTEPRRLGSLSTGSNFILSMAFSPEGKTLATIDIHGTVRLWDMADRTKPHRISEPLTGHNDQVSSAVFSPNRQIVATNDADGTVTLWDLAARTRPRTLGLPLTGHRLSVQSARFSPDGQILATGSDDTTAILWDVSDRTRPHQLGQPLTGHNGYVLSVAFSPDGRTLATSVIDGTVILWDVQNRSQPHQLGPSLTEPPGTVWSAVFSPDGQTLATGRDTTVILWDVTDRTHPDRLDSPLNGHTGSVRPITFSPNGNILATGSEDGTVVLWDVRDRKHAHRLGQPLTGHNGYVLSVAFSQDGRTLATSDARKVILWDLDDQTQPRQVGPPLTGHKGSITTIMFAPDGQTLASGSQDGTVILWNVGDRSRPQRLGPPLAGHTDAVSSVAFSPDGRTLATSSTDGTAILWDVSIPLDIWTNALQRACAAAGRGLNQVEWRTIVTGIAYRNTCGRFE